MTMGDVVELANMAWLDYAGSTAKFAINGKTFKFNGVDAVKILNHLIHERGWVGGGSSYGRKLVWAPQ